MEVTLILHSEAKPTFFTLHSLTLFNQPMRTAIVGGGAAGFFLAINLKEMEPRMEVVILEAGRPISGEYLVSFADGIFAFINGSNIIWMDAPQTSLMPLKATPFYFILPPAQYEDLSVTVVPAEGAARQYILPDEIEIEAGAFTCVSFEELEEND